MFTLKDEPQEQLDRPQNIGDYLAYHREKQGLSHVEAARELYFPVERIQMLENLMEEKDLYDVYVRGYWRSYCKFLGLDPDSIFSSKADRTSRHIDQSDTVTDERTHELIRIWGSAFILALIVGLLALWWIEQNIEIPAADPAIQIPLPQDALSQHALLRSCCHGRVVPVPA